MRSRHWLFCGLVASVLMLGSAGRAIGRPALWMFPPPDMNGAGLRALFEQPADWARTRLRIDGLGYADHWLASQFTDAELRRWLPQLAAWHLRLGLEVGALRVWGPTAEIAFAKDRPKWDRFIADGARIDSIAMDEPLAFARRGLSQTDAFAADQTARFIALVRHAYPGIRIGDIEPYPGIAADDLLAFLDAVQSRLRRMHVRGLDFFRADVDWMHFRPGDAKGAAGWKGVRAVQAECDRRGIPFSLVYWAADYPSLNRVGQATEHSWDDGVLREGAAYRAAGGVPDEIVLESWVHTPSQVVPETDPDSFTRSVLDFTTQFAPFAGR